MAKKKNQIIKMQSLSSAYFYTTTKTKRLQQEGKKLKLKKYDPVVNKHVWFVEKKI